VKMGDPITLDIELDFLRDFLDHVLKEAQEEIDKISTEHERGKFKTSDDYENALFFPPERCTLVVRTVYYEITAIIEHELQQLAHNARFNLNKDDKLKLWRFDEDPKKWQTQLSSMLNKKKNKKEKGMPFDLNYGDVISLINKCYRVDISSLSGHQRIQLVRDRVNDFKHRKGFKDPRNPLLTNGSTIIWTIHHIAYAA
jgi:hypothetical protein